MRIDSHTHLNDEAFQNDLDIVLKNMHDHDVKKAMIISLNLNDLAIARKIKYDDIIFKRSIGIFPTDTYLFKEEEINNIIKEFDKEDIDAIGEIGLDYHWDKEHKDIQKALFKKQLEIASILKKPVIIHSRDASEDTYNILKEYDVKAILHCYSGSKEMAKAYLKLGHYVSFAGPITFKNAKEPLEVLKVIPLDRLLIETDCPYLSPEPKRGKRNEPANIIYTGNFIAEALNIDIMKLQNILEDNYESIFSKQ